jgi:hypothetical protein
VEAGSIFLSLVLILLLAGIGSTMVISSTNWVFLINRKMAKTEVLDASLLAA